jgi:hypothetical protein
MFCGILHCGRETQTTTIENMHLTTNSIKQLMVNATLCNSLSTQATHAQQSMFNVCSSRSWSGRTQ